MNEIYDRRFYVLGGWFTWVAVAVIAAGAIGAGATIYGANKQASSSAAANEANKTAVEQANDQSWTNYLLSRGLSTGSVIPAGTMPTGGQAVNTRLPLWATVDVPNQYLRNGGGASLQSALVGGGAPTVGGYAPSAAKMSAGGGTPPGMPSSIGGLPVDAQFGTPGPGLNMSYAGPQMGGG